MADSRSAIDRRNEALENASALFNKFELGEVSDDDFLNALIVFLKTQTVCNQLWMDRCISDLEDSAQASFDPIARWDIAVAGTFLLIDSCAEGLQRRRGKRVKGPHKLEAARSLVLRLQQIYERATDHKATISTANLQSQYNTEKLSGPYPEFLRQADPIFKKIITDTKCKWPTALPSFAKEMRRKPRKTHSRLK
jgi:hypothetical protein